MICGRHDKSLCSMQYRLWAMVLISLKLLLFVLSLGSNNERFWNNLLTMVPDITHVTRSIHNSNTYFGVTYFQHTVPFRCRKVTKNHIIHFMLLYQVFRSCMLSMTTVHWFYLVEPCHPACVVTLMLQRWASYIPCTLYDATSDLVSL